jgi:transcriptional regulator with XRE-family HTH domain
MRETERKQERKRLDFEMRSYRNAGRAKNPTQGLLAAIRRSLRIPVSEIAGNARVNRSGVYDFEASERRRTITLKSMAKIADAMGCKVVYGIVPKGGKTLEQLLETRLWASVLGRKTVDSEQGPGTKRLMGREQGTVR